MTIVPPMTGNCPYCGMWAGGCMCNLNPVVMPTIIQSPPPTGWVCPSCQRGVAPFVQFCDHGGYKTNVQSGTVTTAGTGPTTASGFTLTKEQINDMLQRGQISDTLPEVDQDGVKNK